MKKLKIKKHQRQTGMIHVSKWWNNEHIHSSEKVAGIISFLKLIPLNKEKKYGFMIGLFMHMLEKIKYLDSTVILDFI